MAGRVSDRNTNGRPRRRLVAAIGVLLAAPLALTACSSSPSSALDLLQKAKDAGISCPDPGGDKDEPGAESVTCGNLEMFYFKTDKARKDTVGVLVLGAKLGLGDQDTRRFLLGDHFCAYGPVVKLQALQQKISGDIYDADGADKHL